MRLLVRYFAGASAAARCEEEWVDLPGTATVASLHAQLSDVHPALVPVLEVASLLLDGVTSRSPGDPLTGVGQVDVLPPFAGG